MDMEQWAQVRRKVLMDGCSKRSVMLEEGLPLAGEAGGCRRYPVLQSSESTTGDTPRPSARWSRLRHPVPAPSLSLPAPPAHQKGLHGAGKRIHRRRNRRARQGF